MDSKRRKILQVVAGTVVTGGVLTALPRAHGQLNRPPGALTEPEFLARCQRCMRCVDACYPTALGVGHLSDGIENVGTPVLPDPSKCIWCMECVRACPSGALAKVSKTEVSMGVVRIEESKCLAYLKKRRCNDCEKACRDRKAISMKDRRYPVIDPEKCNGCGACLRRCPALKDGAMWLDVTLAKRFDPPAARVLAKLESRTEPEPRPPLAEWARKRLKTLAETYDLDKK